MNKYQEALDEIMRYSPLLLKTHKKSFNILQELVDKYGAMYEDMIKDAEFLKEVVEPHLGEIKNSFPIKILQAIDKEGNFVGNTTIEPDYEKALDKACKTLEYFDRACASHTDPRGMRKNREQWKGWLLRDETI